MMRRRTAVALSVALATTPWLLVTAVSGSEASADPTLSVASSSPTGPAVAFQWVSSAGDGVHLMEADGTDVRPLFDDLPASTFHPDWSPDGTRLAYEVAGPSGGDIWTSKADGSDRELLVDHTTCPSDCADVVYPAWSPDGQAVAFARFRFGDAGFVGSTVEVIDVATRETRVVAEATPNTVLEYPRWSPDGEAIVYQATSFPTATLDLGAELGSVIEVVAADGSDAQPMTLTDRAMFAAYPDWSSTGLIVFTTYDLSEFQGTDEPSNLYTIEADGSGLTRLTAFGEADQRATQPTWTPDGERILFTLADHAPDFDVPRHAASIDADGGDLTVLSPPATHPRLQPQQDR